MPAISEPATSRTDFEPAATASGALYQLLNSIVAPRPIAWVGTRSAAGVYNLAPHSYCMIVSANPPIVAFSSTGAKDTLRNVRETGEFVWNHVPLALVEEMNRSSADFPPHESEFGWAGLAHLPGVVVAAPRVAASPAALECRVREILAFGSEPSYLIISDVVHISVASELLAAGVLDYARTQSVGRLARAEYAAVGEIFALPRPTYRGLLDAGERPTQPGLT